MLVYCWVSIADGGPTLSQHWVSLLSEVTDVLLSKSEIKKYKMNDITHTLECNPTLCLRVDYTYIIIIMIITYCHSGFQRNMRLD